MTNELDTQICFKRIVSVLGCTISDSNLHTVVSQLGKGSKETKSKHSTSYYFSEYGLEFILLPERVEHVVFMINTASTRDSWSKPYSLDFPAGIRPDDTKSQVVAKLDSSGIICDSMEGDRAFYRFPDFQLYFLFESDKPNSLMSIVDARLLGG